MHIILQLNEYFLHFDGKFFCIQNLLLLTMSELFIVLSLFAVAIHNNKKAEAEIFKGAK